MVIRRLLIVARPLLKRSSWALTRPRSILIILRTALIRLRSRRPFMVMRTTLVVRCTRRSLVLIPCRPALSLCRSLPKLSVRSTVLTCDRPRLRAAISRRLACLTPSLRMLCTLPWMSRSRLRRSWLEVLLTLVTLSPISRCPITVLSTRRSLVSLVKRVRTRRRRTLLMSRP